MPSNTRKLLQSPERNFLVKIVAQFLFLAWNNYFLHLNYTDALWLIRLLCLRHNLPPFFPGYLTKLRSIQCFTFGSLDIESMSNSFFNDIFIFFRMAGWQVCKVGLLLFSLVLFYKIAKNWRLAMVKLVKIKVIVHKSRGEVSLVEQDTIEYVS